MKKNEKLVIQGNEFYILDLDCLEKKRKEKSEKNREKTIPRKHNSSK